MGSAAEDIELKGRRQGEGSLLKGALTQIDGYLDQFDFRSGILIIFDRRPSALRKRPNPVITRTRTPSGREITLLTA